MLNCRETTELCSQELERHLSLRERVAMKAHLMMCRHCSNFKKQIGLFHEAATAYSHGQVDVPQDKTNHDPESGT